MVAATNWLRVGSSLAREYMSGNGFGGAYIVGDILSGSCSGFGTTVDRLEKP